MAQFIKKLIPVRIEEINDAVIERLRAQGKLTEDGKLIELEGHKTLGLRTPEFLVEGVRGELYTIPVEIFAQYKEVEGRAGYYVKSMPIIVDAIRVDFAGELDRPGGKHRCKPGDYIVFMTDDNQYFVDAAIFLETYDARDLAATRYLEYTREQLASQLATTSATG